MIFICGRDKVNGLPLNDVIKSRLLKLKSKWQREVIKWQTLGSSWAAGPSVKKRNKMYTEKKSTSLFVVEVLNLLYYVSPSVSLFYEFFSVAIYCKLFIISLMVQSSAIDVIRSGTSMIFPVCIYMVPYWFLFILSDKLLQLY